MHHVAIMKKSWKLIPKIISAEKTIESRWYQTRRTPWNRIRKGDKIFFKNSSEAVIAKARVKRVRQFHFKSMDDIISVVGQYGKAIQLIEENPKKWGSIPRFAILIFLENPQLIKKPFHIDKTGFGSAAAWISIPNINRIKKKTSRPR